MPFGGIGVTLLDQPLNHGNHLGDILGGPWHMIGLKIAERCHIFKIPRYGFFGDCRNGSAAFGCTLIYFIIYISEIAHIGDMLWAINML